MNSPSPSEWGLGCAHQDSAESALSDSQPHIGHVLRPGEIRWVANTALL